MREMYDEELMEGSVIAAEMVIQGDIRTGHNLRIMGSITGDIDINGALVVEGCVNGNTKSESFSAGTGKVNGNITAENTVVVENDAVIIGNINGTNITITGAVKGDIDASEHLIIGSTAKIMGNIRSRSMSVESGAIITGTCTQCYADVTAEAFFDNLENPENVQVSGQDEEVFGDLEESGDGMDPDDEVVDDGEDHGEEPSSGGMDFSGFSENEEEHTEDNGAMTGGHVRFIKKEDYYDEEDEPSGLGKASSL